MLHRLARAAPALAARWAVPCSSAGDACAAPLLQLLQQPRRRASSLVVRDPSYSEVNEDDVDFFRTIVGERGVVLDATALEAVNKWVLPGVAAAAACSARQPQQQQQRAQQQQAAASSRGDQRASRGDCRHAMQLRLPEHRTQMQSASTKRTSPHVNAGIGWASTLAAQRWRCARPRPSRCCCACASNSSCCGAHASTHRCGACWRTILS